MGVSIFFYRVPDPEPLGSGSGTLLYEVGFDDFGEFWSRNLILFEVGSGWFRIRNLVLWGGFWRVPDPEPDPLRWVLEGSGQPTIH